MDTHTSIHDPCTTRIMTLEEALDVCSEDAQHHLEAAQAATRDRDQTLAHHTLLADAVADWITKRAGLRWAQSVTPDDIASATRQVETAENHLVGVYRMVEDIKAIGDVILVHRNALNQRDAKLAAYMLQKGPLA
jgi:hypothetical protein